MLNFFMNSLILVLTLTTASCSKVVIVDTSGALGDTVSISARVTNSNGSVRRLKVQIAETNSAAVETVGEAWVAVDGSFRLSAPDLSIMLRFVRKFHAECVTSTVTPSEAEFARIQFRAFDASDTAIGQLVLANRSRTGIAAFIFAPQDFIAHGSCNREGREQDWDLSVLSGWNVVIAEGFPQADRMYSSQIPQDFEWFLRRDPCSAREWLPC